MSRLGVFDLQIRPGDETMPASVRISVQHFSPDEAGRPLLTPECTSLFEVETAIRLLQGELDEIRERARRVFDTSGRLT